MSWKRGAIGVDIKHRHEFMNCSKVLMNIPWNYDGVYKGKYAKYFDECKRSQADSATGTDP